MKGSDAHQVQKGVRYAEGTERNEITVHDAVEKDVAVSADHRSQEGAAPRNAPRIPDESFAWHPRNRAPDAQAGLAYRAACHRAKQPDDSRAGIGVEQSMYRVLATDQMVSGFKVRHALCETKQSKTELPRDGRLKRHSRAEMERREWHGRWSWFLQLPDRRARTEHFSGDRQSRMSKSPGALRNSIGPISMRQE